MTELRIGFYGKIAFSRYHQLFGSRTEALAALKSMPQYPEIEITAETLIINRLIEMDALELAHERLSAIREEQQELTWARLRVYVKQDNVAGAAQLLDHPHVKVIPDWILAEAMTRPSMPDARTKSPGPRRAQRDWKPWFSEACHCLSQNPVRDDPDVRMIEELGNTRDVVLLDVHA